MATEIEAGQGKRPSGKRRTRIMVDVSPELRRRIKVAAAQSDLSVRAYVERILEQAVPHASGGEATQRQEAERKAEWVAELTRFRDELARKHPEIQHEDSVELIRQMREERNRHLESL